MLKSENTAAPPTADTVLVPARIAPAVPVPPVIVNVMLGVTAVTTLPTASWTVTWTAGARSEPASAVRG